MTNLYELSNYVCPEPYVSGHIYEYDIQKANITMLRKAGAISQKEYERFMRMPKYEREISIGLLIRGNKRMYNIIADNIKDAKKDLMFSCKIKDNEVVRIANDAVFLTRQVSNDVSDSPTPSYFCRDGETRFIQKSEYTTMLRLGPLIIFYNSYTKDIRVIGIKDEELELHDGYMLTFIVSIIEMMERASLDSTLHVFTETYNKFLRLELDLPFYREFNANSMYVLYSGRGERYMMSSYNGLIRYLDIGYNAFILRELYGVLIGKYKLI